MGRFSGLKTIRNSNDDELIVQRDLLINASTQCQSKFYLHIDGHGKHSIQTDLSPKEALETKRKAKLTMDRANAVTVELNYRKERSQ
ncbi:MAG: hypothetical protein FWE16_00340 [Firmicutes bacterium]|nr:hypothetical protein [Bacillota bacterium]